MKLRPDLRLPPERIVANHKRDARGKPMKKGDMPSNWQNPEPRNPVLADALTKRPSKLKSGKKRK